MMNYLDLGLNSNMQSQNIKTLSSNNSDWLKKGNTKSFANLLPFGFTSEMDKI